MNDKQNQIVSNLASEDEKIYIAVAVENEGRLENIKIDFENANFDIKDKPGVHDGNMDSIAAGDSKVIELPIVARKSSNFNLSLLNMTSQIKLTGEYIDSQGNVTDLEEVKEVNINWVISETRGEDIELSQKLIANDIYNINGDAKRVVQVLVDAKLNNNKAPIKRETITLNVPDVDAKPESVRVIAKTTKATNGKSEIEFNDQETSDYSYNEEDGKVTINVKNDRTYDNFVSWEQNAKDEFIVTYVYDRDTEILEFTSALDAQIVLYGVDQEIYLGNSNSKQMGEIEGNSDIVSVERWAPGEIYKGYMYTKQDTDYSTVTDVFVSYADAVDGIEINDSGEVKSESNEVLSSVFYKTTINKKQAINVLGNEGIIDIFDGEDLENQIAQIDLSEETENDIYEITYSSDTNKIFIKTTKPVREGRLLITNEKKIVIQEVNELVRRVNNLDAVCSVNEKTLSGVIELKEPTANINMSIDKDTISSQVEETLQITTTFKALNPSDKLFNNPVLYVELPEDIKDVQIENVTLSEGELSVKSSEIKQTESGKKILVVEIEGEQSKYSQNQALEGDILVVDLRLRTNDFMADKNTQINSLCINNGENINLGTQPLKIGANKGLLTKISLQIGENTKEETNQDIVMLTAKPEDGSAFAYASFINNYDSKMENISITGTAKSHLNEGISSNDAIRVYYLDEENNWVEEIDDITKVKTFRIDLVNGLNVGGQLDIEYNTLIPDDISIEDNLFTFTIDYTVEGQASSKTLYYKAIKETDEPHVIDDPQIEENGDINVIVEAYVGNKKIENNEDILNGQVVKYKVGVQNSTNKTLENAKLNINIENGVFYGLVPQGVVLDTSLDENGEEMYPDGRLVYTYDEMEEQTQQIEIGNINPGDYTIKEYMIVAYKNEGIENGNVFKNRITVSSNNNEEKEIEDNRNILDGSISLKLKFGYSEGALAYSNSDVDIILEVKNIINKDVENVDIVLDLPNGIECDVDDQMHIDTHENATIYKDNDGRVHVVFARISKYDMDSVKVTLKTGSISYESVRGSVTLIATATVKDDNNTYISNDYTINFEQGETLLETKITSNREGEILKDEERIKYYLEIRNKGSVDANVSIFNNSKGLIIEGYKLIENGEEKESITYDMAEEYWTIDTIIKQGSTIIIELDAMVDLTSINVLDVRNKIVISGWQIGEIETEEIVNKIDREEKPEPDKEYDISGLVWIDKNSDGIRNEDEVVLRGVKVYLLDSKGSIVKNKDGEDMIQETSILGTYKFSNLEVGEYVVAFEYDNTIYKATKYHVTDASIKENSDAIEKEVNINGKTQNMAVTDVLKVTNKDIENIDLGLVPNKAFDLRLDKYVTKIVVTNGNATATYDFGETSLAKIEIGASKVSGSTVVVEYNIVITNEGDVAGYITNIADYLPQGLEFSSELNKEWYVLSNGTVNYMQLEPKAIKPGESQTVKLILKKTLTSSSLGTFMNTAEIQESTNLENIADIDSVAGNKKVGEDDISEAGVIISIATGGSGLYIGIIFASLAIIGSGIYFINKRVLTSKEGGVPYEK